MQKRKSRKVRFCLCCGEIIDVGDDYYQRISPYLGCSPDDFCSDCGPFIEQGYSFNRAREQAKKAKEAKH